MKRNLALGGVAAGVGVAIAVPALLVSHSHARTQEAVRTFAIGAQTTQIAPQASTEIIDSGANEVLSPPTATQVSAVRALTAAQAWSDWSDSIGTQQASVPADETVTLGVLNLPYHATNQVVYAFESPVTSCSGNEAEGESSPPGQCVQWIFLDPSTGNEVDATETPINSAP